jgi:hypothetical protein
VILSCYLEYRLCSYFLFIILIFRNHKDIPRPLNLKCKFVHIYSDATWCIYTQNNVGVSSLVDFGHIELNTFRNTYPEF